MWSARMVWGSNSVAAQPAEGGEWGRLGDAHLGGEVADGGREAHPYDVLHVDVVAEEPLLVVVNVDDAYEAVALLAEIV